MAKKDVIYKNISALKAVQMVLADAEKAVSDPTRTLHAKDIPEIVAAAVGAGVGVVSGVGIVTAGAATGTTGAAAITSGLATAGSVIGGGMMTGIFVAAAPVAIFAVLGYRIISSRNAKILKQEKEALLQQAIQKHDKIIRELNAKVKKVEGRAEYLSALNVKLEEIITNLKRDLAI